MYEPRIYVSTGLMPMTTREASEALLNQGVRALELSGGIPEPGVLGMIAELRRAGAYLQPHNYFPAPSEHFVFNLSAPAARDRERSIAFAKAAIDTAVFCGASRYSFHAGFLGTPRLADLGRSWRAVEQVSPEEGIALFQTSVARLNEYAQTMGIQLLVENNVLTEGTATSNGPDVLLMTSPEGIERVMRLLPEGVQLLLDVGHLKVSAKTLGFSADAAMSFLANLVGGYHLSENDGMSDSNDPLREDSWFWNHLSDNVAFASLEVITDDDVSILDQVKLCSKRWCSIG